MTNRTLWHGPGLARGTVRAHTDRRTGKPRTGRGTLAALLLCTSSLLALAQPPAAPRIAPLSEGQLSDAAHGAAAALGMPNLAATYAHHPELAEALLPHLDYVWRASTLPARDRALLALRTAWLTRSSYLWAHRAAAARDEGFDAAELERIARGPDTAGWDDFEAALLRAADELHVDAFISDATWQTLASRYDSSQLIEAIDTVGALTMHAGAASSLGVEVEAGLDEPLPTDIPYSAAAEPTVARLVDGTPRIPPVEAEDGAPSANVFRTFVLNPPADRIRGAINRHVNFNSTLSPLHRELLLIRIGILCRSEYEYAAHVRVGRRLGMTDADVARILAGPGHGKDPLEDALLRATDELHRDDVIAGDTWETLAAALDVRQLLDVLFAVGGYRSASMLISSAGVQLDADMADYRFPPALR